MRIGELSRATGASTRSLRYYEDQGLLSSVRRSNGYREYGEEAVRQVAFIQDLYRAGLPSQIIRDILPTPHRHRPQASAHNSWPASGRSATNSPTKSGRSLNAARYSTSTSRAQQPHRP
ncbi:MerR family transcriptional regulator [Streptomyces sp. M19]